MYPNPAQNELKIDLRDVDLPIKLDLITIDGTVRHQEIIQHTHFSLDLEQLQLKDGLYLINLRNKKGDVSIHKLVIKGKPNRNFIFKKISAYPQTKDLTTLKNLLLHLGMQFTCILRGEAKMNLPIKRLGFSEVWL
jgi:hypothetical protein